MPRRAKNQTTDLGWMIRRAMDLKGYTYGDLTEVGHLDGSHVSRVVKGERGITREQLRRLCIALAPHLVLDEAMLAAGYLPDDERKASILRTLGRLPAAALEELGRRTHDVTVTLESEGAGARDPECQPEYKYADNPEAQLTRHDP